MTDITIIGGGVIGLMTAKELLEAGAKVRIVEKNAIGQESSWAGGGILLPLYPWRQEQAISTLVQQSLKLYPALAQQLIQTTGLDPEVEQCGLLISQNPDIDVAINWCRHYQIEYHHAAPAQRLANLNLSSLNPLWLPTIGNARNPRLLKALKQFLLQAEVELIEHSPVIGIKQQQSRITSVLTAQAELPVQHLIIASGAWTALLHEQLFPNLSAPKISPVRGQMLLFDAPAKLLSCMVLDGDHYLIPRRDGKILAGSTVEHVGFDKTITEAAEQTLYQFALRLLPELKQCPVLKHWAGLRPGTADGIPYIGNHPEFENLSINAGHFRNGLVMAPASARLMTDLILKRLPSIDPKPYHFN